MAVAHSSGARRQPQVVIDFIPELELLIGPDQHLRPCVRFKLAIVLTAY